MKALLILVLALIGFTASAQQVEQKQDTVTQEVVVKLTEWQEKQIVAFDQQRKYLDEQTKLLWSAIMDANKIDEKKIAKVNYRPGEFVLRVRKK